MESVISNMASHNTLIQLDEEQKLPKLKQRSVAENKGMHQLTTKIVRTPRVPATQAVGDGRDRPALILVL